MGFPPKPADKRARNNKDRIDTRVVPLVRVEAPELPTLVDWHWRTRDWWSMWQRSALSADFTESDWDNLTDTALIHSAFWNGNMSLAGELRLRVAKFGATPEDRARLRIVFADADEKDGGQGKPVTGGASAAGGRYGNVQAIRPEA
jgi:hypothetical protein